MDEASEAVYALKPVTFRYNREYDATQTVAFGLIAQDVAEVNPELIGRNDKGNPNRSATSRSTLCCVTNFSRNIARSSNSRKKLTLSKRS